MTKEKRRKPREPQAVNNSGKIRMVKSGAPFRHRWRLAYPPNKTNYAPMQGGTLAAEYKRKEGFRMSDLTRLFKVGQRVFYRNDDFDALEKFMPCTVKETASDYIIITDDKTQTDFYIESGFNLDMVYPAYNFSL